VQHLPILSLKALRATSKEQARQAADKQTKDEQAAVQTT